MIRHGETESADRLLGMTDDPLSENGKRMVSEKCAAKLYPAAKRVYSSELSCCRETANLIYPTPAVILKELSAPDYGDFDGQALPVLLRDKVFADWADPQELKVFPNGEMPYDIDTRAQNAIRKIGEGAKRGGSEQCAVISHKMIILAILRHYCVPRSSYIDWELSFGGGYLIEYDTIESTAGLLSKI